MFTRTSLAPLKSGKPYNFQIVHARDIAVALVFAILETPPSLEFVSRFPSVRVEGLRACP
jgi:hypothetical protein